MGEFGSERMDLEKLEKMAKLVQQHLEKLPTTVSFSAYRTRKAELENLIVLASKALPDHDAFFKNALKNINSFDRVDAVQATEYVLTIVEMEKATESKIKEMKIFESAEDKMKQAELSFRKDDYPSTFHNLNTALELVLKDKLGIPTTITKINTSNIIEILAKHKIELHMYLTEARKRIVMIDNKIKHQGYSPSKIDCINGIKVMEELISRLRDREIKLTEDIRNKIYQGL